MLSVQGFGLCLIAIFSWGTALVPLRSDALATNRRNGVALCTIALSAGYLLAAGVAVLVLTNSGGKAWASSGLIGGVVWASGKLLNILAVSGAAGLAAGQAVQCVVNVGTAFAVGVLLRGEPCTQSGAAGVAVLTTGLVVIVLPSPRCPLGGRGKPIQAGSQTEALLEADDGGLPSSVAASECFARTVSLALAACAGVCFGFQSVPLLFDSSHPSAWAYSITQAVAQFGVVVLACSPFVVQGHRRECRAALAAGVAQPPLVPKPVALLAACGGGMLFFAAAASINVAVTFLGVSVAQPLSQMNMVVAACWGICLFGEVPLLLDRVRFFLGCTLALGGAALLTVS